LNKPGDVTGAQIAGFNVWGFATGIIAVWLYASIRPRYGAGMKTAAIAGLGVWLTGYLLANVPPIILDLFPARMMVLSLVVGIVEVTLGTIAGASVYREESAVSSRGAARAQGASV